MSDEVAPQQEPQKPQGERRSLFGLMAIIVAIVVIVLLFLLLRGCSTAQDSDNADTGTKEIVSVAGLTPAPGKVSIWVARGSSIDLVLTAAGLNGSAVTDMGGGRFVVAVPTGSETKAVAKLKTIKGVNDAGLVYTDPRQATPAPATTTTGSAPASSTGY